MSENPTTEIEILKQQLAAAQALQKQVDAPPKVDPKPKKKRKQPKVEPPKVVAPIPTYIPSISIVWIDKRYHIFNIKGISNGQHLIVRELADIDKLIADLTYAKTHFTPPKE